MVTVNLITHVQSTYMLGVALIGVWSVIWASYFFAVKDGTVEPPFSTGTFCWPMISDTWVNPAGKYISRIFMPPFICMWALFCWTVSDWLDMMTWRREDYHNLLIRPDPEALIPQFGFSRNHFSKTIVKYQNKIFRYLIQIGSFGFLTCIAVNEDDNDRIHSWSALLFFVSQGLFCSNVVIQLLFHPGTAHSKKSLFLKACISSFYNLLLLTFGYLGSFNKWGEYEVYIAVIEWLAVATVCTFHLSMRPELQHNMILGIGDDNTKYGL